MYESFEISFAGNELDITILTVYGPFFIPQKI